MILNYSFLHTAESGVVMVGFFGELLYFYSQSECHKNHNTPRHLPFTIPAVKNTVSLKKFMAEVKATGIKQAHAGRGWWGEVIHVSAGPQSAGGRGRASCSPLLCVPTQTMQHMVAWILIVTNICIFIRNLKIANLWRDWKMCCSVCGLLWQQQSSAWYKSGPNFHLSAWAESLLQTKREKGRILIKLPKDLMGHVFYPNCPLSSRKLHSQPSTSVW